MVVALPFLLMLQTDAESAQRRYDAWRGADPCATANRAPDEVVVCGRRQNDRDRLPLYVPEAPPDRTASSPREIVDVGRSGGARWECGVFQHQRACSKSEMRASGWGGGLDPVTALGRLVGAIDEAPPPPLPEVAGPR